MKKKTQQQKERLEMEICLVDLLELALIANVGIEGVEFN